MTEGSLFVSLLMNMVLGMGSPVSVLGVILGIVRMPLYLNVLVPLWTSCMLVVPCLIDYIEFVCVMSVVLTDMSFALVLMLYMALAVARCSPVSVMV